MKSTLLTGTALVSALALVSTSSIAQDAEEGSSSPFEEILVTAQKREATLLETPVAVTAVGGADIERAQARDIRDLQTLVPSLQVNTFNSSTDTAFSIRGIGSTTFNFGIEPAVGVFVDGVYRARNGASINDFMNLERVEVLRGPQSTLFGKNTSAGVINYVTKKPNMEEFDGEAELTFGNYQAFIARGGVSGPLVEDKVGFRLDANYNIRDGFVTNVDGRDLNNRNRYGFMGQVYFTPRDNVSFRVIADYADYDEDCCAAPFLFYSPGAEQLVQAFGGNTFGTDPNDRLQAVDDNINTSVVTKGVSGELNWDFEKFTLTSITAYREYDEDSEIDPDFTDLPLTTGRFFDRGYRTFTQELRFTSSDDSSFRWQGGVYYFNQELFNDQVLEFAPTLYPFLDAFTGGAISGIEAGLGLPANTFFAPGTGLNGSRFDQGNETLAAFVQFDYDITDKLTITGGLRFTRDSKSVVSNIQINDAFGALDFVALGPSLALEPAFVQQAALLGIPADQASALVAGFRADPTNPAFQPVADTFAFLTANATDPAFNPFLELASLQLNPPAPDIDDSFTDSEVTGNLILNYTIDDSNTVYASYSRGFKGGAFALDAGAARVGRFRVDPEIVDSFEIGYKARLMDNRISINTAVFTQETKGFQQFTFVGAGFFPSNADVRTSGFEFEGAFKVNDYFRLTTGLTWFWENEYTAFENAPCPQVNFEGVEGCALTQLPGSVIPVPVRDGAGLQQSGFSDFYSVVTADFIYPVGDDLEFFARGEYAYTGSRFLTVGLEDIQRSPEANLLGASMGIGAQDGSWQIQVWGRNLLDSKFLQSSFPNPIGFGINAYPSDPQTYGVTLRTKF